MFPELFGTLGTSLILILVAIYQIQKRLRRRRNTKEITENEQNEMEPKGYENKAVLDDEKGSSAIQSSTHG